jgi:hypothetical protein
VQDNDTDDSGLKDPQPVDGTVRRQTLGQDRFTHSHLSRRMMARVASTALLRVIMSKSPRVDPRYSAICSPHQSKSFSKGMIERKHTDPKTDRHQQRNDGFRSQRWYTHAKVMFSPQRLKWETQANGRKINNTFKSGDSK